MSFVETLQKVQQISKREYTLSEKEILELISLMETLCNTGESLPSDAFDILLGGVAKIYAAATLGRHMAAYGYANKYKEKADELSQMIAKKQLQVILEKNGD